MANRKTVLIVDDEVSILQSLQRIFELSGDFEVITAQNVEEAWKAINNTLPDLIISDIAMPEVNGIEFCKMIRSNEITRNLPFIFLTAKSDQLLEGIKAGGDDFIIKPFNLDEVMAKIEAIFRRIRNTRELVLQLKGSLEDYTLDDILQLCHDKSLSGTIILYNQGETGKIVVEKGDISDVIYADFSPTRALDHLRMWNNGLFVIRPDDIDLKPELMKRKIPKQTSPKLNEIIPVVEKTLWWVGHRDLEKHIQVNSFMRVFDSTEKKINFLVYPGSTTYFEQHQEKINAILNDLSNVHVLAVTNSIPDLLFNFQKLNDANPKLIYLTSRHILSYLKPLGVNSRYVKPTDTLKNNTLTLATDHSLQIITIPFAPEHESFMIYDKQSRVLFSGWLFSSVIDFHQANRFYALEEDWEAVRKFHQSNIPTGAILKYAVEQIKKLTPSPLIIAPQFGLIWRGLTVTQFLERIYYLETGIDLLLDQSSFKQVNQTVEACNQLITHVQQLFPFSWIEGKLRQDPFFMAKCEIGAEKINKIFGNPDHVFERLLANLLHGEDDHIAGQIQVFAKKIAREYDLTQILQEQGQMNGLSEFFRNA